MLSANPALAFQWNVTRPAADSFMAPISASGEFRVAVGSLNPELLSQLLSPSLQQHSLIPSCLHCCPSQAMCSSSNTPDLPFPTYPPDALWLFHQTSSHTCRTELCSVKALWVDGKTRKVKKHWNCSSCTLKTQFCTQARCTAFLICQC